MHIHQFHKGGEIQFALFGERGYQRYKTAVKHGRKNACKFDVMVLAVLQADKYAGFIW